MASTSGDAAKSPLEHVWRQFIPQGHDQALRNAFYNVAAAVFVGGAVAAAWSVYLVLQPFVQALMWAVLCGSVLHPMKHGLSTSVKKWLFDVQETKSLLSLSVALLPVTCLDNLSEFVGWYFMNHMKGVITVTVILPVVYIIIHHTPSALTNFAYSILSCSLYSMKTFLDIVGYFQYLVILAIIGYFAMVIFNWTPEKQVIYRRLSLPIWILATATISCWWPSMSVPLFIIFSLLLLGGVWIEVKDNQLKPQGHSSEAKQNNLLMSVIEVCLGETERKESDDKIMEANEVDNALTENSEMGTEEPGRNRHSQSEDIVEKNTSQTASEIQLEASHPSHLDLPRPQTLEARTKTCTSAFTSLPSGSSSDKNVNVSEDSSNVYLKGVFVACVLVELWRHSYLLSLLPLSLGYYCIKKLTSYHIFGEGFFHGKAHSAQEAVHKKFHDWVECRNRVLLPLPLRGVFKLLKRSDRKIVKNLADYVDVCVTIFLMLAVLIFFILWFIFLAVQIQGEGMQLISMGSQLVNATIVNNPQFHELLPEGLNDFMNSAIDNSYLYGREWITNVVRSMLGETDEEKAAALEKQVVELWDRIYQAWVVSHPQPPYSGPVMTSEAVAVTFDSLVNGLVQTPGLISISALSDVIRDNIGTVMSVMEGIWTILLSNLSLALSAITTTSSLLLGGSLSILNAVLNLIVFLSSLFYILSVSNSVYKPVAIIGGLSPAQMNSLGTAVEDSVNGVFKASFKMGAFYGMWTWLLHSIFSTNIVYIPAVLGALFGAVPLVGTYWAAVPGVLELFWGHDSPVMALMLFVAQLLPLSCVDTAIYAEIKGGGHPYLTGLAVAGGIFCWGVEGAILGPLLLCILLVVTKMYTSLIQGPSEFSLKYKKFRRCQSELGF